jgi:hypothetical protein
MNSARREKGVPARKSPKTRSRRRTRKGFDAVRPPFSPRPEGDMKTGKITAEKRLAGACPARLRRFSLFFYRFDVTEFHLFNEG